MLRTNSRRVIGRDPTREYQRAIIRNAPRSVIYYVGGRKDMAPGTWGVIPDTWNARQEAVLEYGATHFDIFTFHRLNPDGTIGRHKFGDFYCRVVAKDTQECRVLGYFLPARDLRS